MPNTSSGVPVVTVNGEAPVPDSYERSDTELYAAIPAGQAVFLPSREELCSSRLMEKWMLITRSVSEGVAGGELSVALGHDGLQIEN